MKVKKFIAKSMPEAMKQIRSELGSDAVILNSKVVQKGGFLGFFTKKNIEVIAAIDPLQPQNIKPVVKEKPKKTIEHPKKGIPSSVGMISTPVINSNNSELIKEIQSLRDLMQDISTGISSSFEHYPEPLKELNKQLIQQEICDKIRQDILTHLIERWYLTNATASTDEVFKWGKEFLIQRFESYQFGGITYQKKYINVVGPTGVGKTTTLAKIAAECQLKDNKKVAFITTDTYRIAAIDQLKTYAKILGIPIEVSYNLSDFKAAKEKFKDYDVVLIDTAGRNFRNKQYVDDLRGIIDFNEEMETLLVLTLTSKLSDMKDIYKQFSLVKIDKFIFTKVDETSVYGPMINLLDESGLGVAYLTNGQNVPDDIQIATPDIVVNTLFGDEKL
ncbi:flagellar biosynthesis protein FlhF [Cytobacillus suaedae]|nr:flagellar biosynthesis protein FlhF [Cytobacillus suaedae]